MSRLEFTLIWIAFAAALLLFMWIAWRARKRRDASLQLPSSGLAGDTIERFTHVSYVSTTPSGEPLERIAVPGLSFKGWADVSVLRDGVAIEVTGEQRVEIAAIKVRGAGTASGRIGKVVESGGLALLKWDSAEDNPRSLESSFRFDTAAEQRRFIEAVQQIAVADPQ